MATASGRTVERAMTVIDAIAERGPHLALRDVVAATRLPKTTVLRVAAGLVARGLLTIDSAGYSLGPKALQLGARAAAHRSILEYQTTLTNLHARFGGFAWLITGSDVTRVQPVTVVCDETLRHDARTRWPRPGIESLVNTAGGRVVLAHHPELLETIARCGIAPTTPRSPRRLDDLLASLDRDRQEGLAIERGQAIAGWQCVAARTADIDGQLTILGVATPIGATAPQRLMRAVLHATAAHGDLARQSTATATRLGV